MSEDNLHNANVPLGAPKAKYKTSLMPSSWVYKPWSCWTLQQKWVWIMRIHPSSMVQNPPLHHHSDKVAHYPIWKQWAWILPRSILPIILHRLYVEITGYSLSPLVTFGLYSQAFWVFSVASLRHYYHMAQKYGYLDSSSPRDEVPDQHISKVLTTLVSAIIARPLLGVMLLYDPTRKPTLSLLLPLSMLTYVIMLDLWFYIYHRAMHEIPSLWKYHKMHHTTKHPNPLLSVYADHEQEIVDIVILPYLTLLVVPLDFYTWFVVQLFVLYSETMLHSGVRLHWETPATSWLLRPFGMELCVEDHDRHHIHGSRTSFNYGKQTRLWDTVFGTKRDRIECKSENIDWDDIAHI